MKMLPDSLAADAISEGYDKFATFLLRKMFIMDSLKRGKPESKPPNLSGNLGESKTFDTDKRTFQTTSKDNPDL